MRLQKAGGTPQE